MTMLISDIAEMLHNASVGTFTPSNYSGYTGHCDTNTIYLNNMPQAPDELIAIYDTGGEGSNFGLPDTKRSIQVLTRSKSAQNCYTKIWQVWTLLINHEDYGFTVHNGRKMKFSAPSTPVSIGKDENGRFEYSANFDVWTKPL